MKSELWLNIGPNQVQYWAKKSTLKVISHIFELISIHISLSAMFGATLEKIAGKISIGPISDQIRSNIGPIRANIGLKKHMCGSKVINMSGCLFILANMVSLV